ncbi:hypothetical protein ACS0TY_022484 [Phlomoides rotata]
MKLAALLLVLLVLTSAFLESTAEDLDCKSKCGKRCKKKFLKRRCISKCGKCCAACKCVPSAEKDDCPCYKNKNKCP